MTGHAERAIVENAAPHRPRVVASAPRTARQEAGRGGVVRATDLDFWGCRPALFRRILGGTRADADRSSVADARTVPPVVRDPPGSIACRQSLETTRPEDDTARRTRSRARAFAGSLSRRLLRYVQETSTYYREAESPGDFWRVMRVRLSQSKLGSLVCPRPIMVDVSLRSLGRGVRLRAVSPCSARSWSAEATRSRRTPHTGHGRSWTWARTSALRPAASSSACRGRGL